LNAVALKVNGRESMHETSVRLYYLIHIILIYTKDLFAAIFTHSFECFTWNKKIAHYEIVSIFHYLESAFFSKTKVCKSFSSFDFYASHVSASSLYFCPILGLSQSYYIIVSRLMLGIGIVMLLWDFRDFILSDWFICINLNFNDSLFEF